MRDLPQFNSVRFIDWSRRNHSPRTNFKVLLLADLYTDYHESKVGKHAIWVLQSMGFEVIIPSIQELGRTFISQGLLDKALTTAVSVVEGLAPLAKKIIQLLD